MTISAGDYFQLLKKGATKKVNSEFNSVRRTPISSSLNKKVLYQNQPKKIVGKPIKEPLPMGLLGKPLPVGTSSFLTRK
jgi:hypothetical protein